jgi:hypothetical protein
LHPVKPSGLDAQVLYRLMSEMATGGNDKSGEYMLEHYNVEEAFKCHNASPTLTPDQKAGLEFAFIDVLARPWDSRADSYGIPNLAVKYRNWAHALQSSYPYVASTLLMQLARTYEAQAAHEDTEESLRGRMR